MPARRLIDPGGVERAVLAVLADRPLGEAAAEIRTDTAELAEAVEVYQAAGRRALEQHLGTDEWWQFYVRFRDWRRSEETAAEHLTPLIDDARRDEAALGWWFIRKHPCWRIRVRVGRRREQVQATVGAGLDELTSVGHLGGWWPGLYEPENIAFGGETGMTVAHELFHADSEAIWHRFGRTDEAMGRREMSLVLCTAFFQAAGHEWYEQGDVWQRVAAERPLPDAVPAGQLEEMADRLRPLLLADTGPQGPLFGGRAPLEPAAAWVAAFRNAGTELRALNQAGGLTRGLRQITAYHIIFHWNRLGLSWRTQSMIANATKSAIVG